MLLAISIFSRLSLTVITVLCICLMVFTMVLSKKNQIRELRPHLSPGILLGFCALLIGVSFVSTQIVTWYDTGGYHFGIVKWLSRYGSVPGLTLIYYGFGYTSAWFAMAAPFNNSILDARAGAVTGGFAFLIVIMHLWICLQRIFLSRDKKEDWFIVISLLLATIIFIRFEIFVSPSQDLPVIILTIVVAWVMIIVGMHKDKISSRGSHLQESDGLILLILSAGAVSMKLSAVPIILIASCYYFLSGKLTVRKVIRYSVVCILVLSPFLAVQAITSGCFLYPSPLVCLDLPWTIGPEKIQEVTEQIRKAAQWSSITPPSGDSMGWITQWIKREKFQMGIILVTIISFLFSVPRLFDGSLRYMKWPIVTGLAGFFYTVIIGPTWRYNLGYISILPAALMSPYFFRRDSFVAKFVLFFQKRSSEKLTPFILLMVISLSIPAISYVRNNTKAFNYLRMEINDAVSKGDLQADINNWTRLILPPRLVNFYIGERDPEKKYFAVEQLEITKQRVNDLTYYKPEKGYQCWDTELPCSQFLTYDDIKLRDHRAGVAAGFMRAAIQ
jgi:hypothetical protein